MYTERLCAMLKNKDGDLPFSCNVDTECVLNCLQCAEQHELTYGIKKMVFQWMTFNGAMNMYEDAQYRKRESVMYGQIRHILKTPIPTGGVPRECDTSS